MEIVLIFVTNAATVVTSRKDVVYSQQWPISNAHYDLDIQSSQSSASTDGNLVWACEDIA